MGAPSVVGSLVAGLLIAVGLQVFLAIAGIAVGMTTARFLLKAKPETTGTAAQPPSLSSRVGGVAIALAVLISVNLVLLVACFLAVKLSASSSFLSGAILGLVIWSAYILIVGWFALIAVRKVSATAWKLVSTGWKGISAGTQTIVGEVVERVSGSSDLPEVQDEIAGYVLHASRKQFSYAEIQNKLQELTSAPADDEALHKQLVRLSRKDFVTWLQQRNDLSEKKIDKIANRLEFALAAITKQTEAQIKQNTDRSRSAIAQSLPAPDLTNIDLEGVQLSLLDWLKRHPLLAPTLLQLVSQTDWPWLTEPAPSRDRPDVPQSPLVSPLKYLQSKANQQLDRLTQTMLQPLEVSYTLTLTASWWLASLAFTTLISAAVGGALATHH